LKASEQKGLLESRSQERSLSEGKQIAVATMSLANGKRSTVGAAFGLVQREKQAISAPKISKLLSFIP
jgi:hypothetical protein